MPNTKFFIILSKKTLLHSFCSYVLFIFSLTGYGEHTIFSFRDYSEFRYRLFIIAQEAHKKLWLSTNSFYDEAFAVQMVMRKKQGVDVKLVITDQINMEDFREKNLYHFLLKNSISINFGHSNSPLKTFILADNALLKINLNIETDTIMEKKNDLIASDLQEYHAFDQWFTTFSLSKNTDSQKNSSTQDFIKPYDYTHDVHKISRSNALVLPKKLKWKKEE